MDKNEIFGKHQISPGDTKSFKLGDKTLFLRREKEGWNVLQPEEKQEREGQPDFTKAEYFQTGKSNSIIIAPALPVKPLVFKGTQMFIAPNQKLTFFIRVPLNIQIYFSKNQPENLIREISWKRLSDSWFGEPDSGEPVFSIGSEYFLKIEETRPNEFEAICPVVLYNNSSLQLEVQRLIIRVENMLLYLNAGKIISSVVEIEYKGKDIISSAEYHYSKLYNGEKQDVLAKPRNTAAKNILKRNFHFIKNIYRSE